MKVILNSLFVLALALGCRAADLNHAAMLRGDAALMDSKAIKSKLTPAFTDDFKRANGTNLGTAWTDAARDGVVNCSLRHHRLRFEIPDGHDLPWGTATLDLAHPAILGHGLRPGDYFEIGLRRLSREGSPGVELFDSDQLRVGGGLAPGDSPLEGWNGVTWVPVSFDAHGEPVAFNWNRSHVLGVLFNSANGYHATFNFYVDGRYAGSWIIRTANKTLDKIGVYAQSKTPDAVVEFDDLKVYEKAR